MVNSSSVRDEYPFLSTKSEAMIPEHLVLGMIVNSPFLLHWVFWHSLALNVVSSCKRIIIFVNCSYEVTAISKGKVL